MSAIDDLDVSIDYVLHLYTCRYKLAAAATRNCSTQTYPLDRSVPMVNDRAAPIVPNFVSTLENAKRDIIALQEEKEVRMICDNDIHAMNCECLHSV